MPIYKCPKCGRQVELPEGKYYCKVCGPATLMVKKPFHEQAHHSDPATARLGVGVPWFPSAGVARQAAILRERGVLPPTTWLDVTLAYLEHYRRVKKALIKAVGGEGNIERIKEYPAEPLEAYYKIAITLKNPMTAELRLIDSDVLEFNGQQLPLYIDSKAYTPYRLRLFRYFAPDPEKLQKEIEERKYVKITLQDFYVQVDNPAWWSRAEEKFVPRPGVFGFLIYK